MYIKTQHNTGISSKFNCAPAIVSSIMGYYKGGNNSVAALRAKSGKKTFWNNGDICRFLNDISISKLYANEFNFESILSAILDKNVIIININMWELPKSNEIICVDDDHCYRVGKRYRTMWPLWYHYLVIDDIVGDYLVIKDPYLSDSHSDVDDDIKLVKENSSLYLISDIVELVRKLGAYSIVV